MAITETEFIQANRLLTGSLNQQGKINFQITPTRDPSINPFTRPFTIRSCTVSVVASNDNPLSKQQKQNLLSQAQKIIIFNNDQFDSVSSNTAPELLQTGSIQLNIIEDQKQFYSIPTASDETSLDFFYFPVQPVGLDQGLLRQTSDSPSNPIDEFTEEVQDQYLSASVVFEPFTTDLNFGFSEFNSTINNVVDSRISSTIVQSDRDTENISPSNFGSIISGSATSAQIQDSLYSDTGWSNARYYGSTTDSDSFNQVLPTINGTSFQGQVFSSGSIDSAICSIDSSNRAIDQFFYTGKETELPATGSDFNSGSLIVKFVDNISKVEAATDSKIWIQQTNSVAKTNQLGLVQSVISCNSL